MELKDAKPYEAAGHFKMVALRLQHKETTGVESFWVGLSHFFSCLPRLVGKAISKEIIFTGEMIYVKTTESIGLLNKVADANS